MSRFVILYAMEVETMGVSEVFQWSVYYFVFADLEWNPSFVQYHWNTLSLYHVKES